MNGGGEAGSALGTRDTLPNTLSLSTVAPGGGVLTNQASVLALMASHCTVRPFQRWPAPVLVLVACVACQWIPFSCSVGAEAPRHIGRHEQAVGMLPIKRRATLFSIPASGATRRGRGRIPARRIVVIGVIGRPNDGARDRHLGPVRGWAGTDEIMDSGDIDMGCRIRGGFCGVRLKKGSIERCGAILEICVHQRGQCRACARTIGFIIYGESTRLPRMLKKAESFPTTSSLRFRHDSLAGMDLRLATGSPISRYPHELVKTP
ncbi:hypothetical protein C8R43DRAFT_1047680 [Mycena crocata]|nr:hypothetical protein C8R43DRAFT_1047680 [Mycena crocata]